MTLHDADMREVFRRLADDWSGDRPVHADHSPHGHTLQPRTEKSEQRSDPPNDSAPDGETGAAMLTGDTTAPSGLTGGCMSKVESKEKLVSHGDYFDHPESESIHCSDCKTNMLKSNEGEPNEEFPYDDIVIGGNCIP